MKVVIAFHATLLAHVLQGFAALSGQAEGSQSTATSGLLPPAMAASTDTTSCAKRGALSSPSDGTTGRYTEGCATTAVSASGRACERLFKQAVVLAGCSTLSSDCILEVRGITVTSLTCFYVCLRLFCAYRQANGVMIDIKVLESFRRPRLSCMPFSRQEQIC
jgi:hypothetical protein